MIAEIILSVMLLGFIALMAYLALDPGSRTKRKDKH